MLGLRHDSVQPELMFWRIHFHEAVDLWMNRKPMVPVTRSLRPEVIFVTEPSSKKKSEPVSDTGEIWQRDDHRASGHPEQFRKSAVNVVNMLEHIQSHD